jgi:hypothetical protein
MLTIFCLCSDIRDAISAALSAAEFNEIDVEYFSHEIQEI